MPSRTLAPMWAGASLPTAPTGRSPAAPSGPPWRRGESPPPATKATSGSMRNPPRSSSGKSRDRQHISPNVINCQELMTLPFGAAFLFQRRDIVWKLGNHSGVSFPSLTWEKYVYIMMCSPVSSSSRAGSYYSVGAGQDLPLRGTRDNFESSKIEVPLFFIPMKHGNNDLCLIKE